MAAGKSTPTSSYAVQLFRPTISGTNVTVQALTAPQTRTPLARPVPSSEVIPKVLLKCTNKEGKKESKTFTIRNINPAVVRSCESLKTLIKAQLSGDVVKEFDVGYQNGSSVVNIRNSEDLQELWSSIHNNNKLIMWCDGLKVRGQKRVIADEESDDVIKPKKKKNDVDDMNEAVQTRIKALKELHSGIYTPMQLRIWAEMLNGDVHCSMADPPTSTMFVRAGSGKPPKKKSTQDDSFSQAITQIASALSPQASRGSIPGRSPGRLIDSRSKCYKQLTDLSNLKQLGLLDDTEYCGEREAIMEALMKLKE